ncbi:MAG: hypothetical protein POELPBGB_00226 [Bacteroidia bacterium]|nr:hypothetical protein [Bacteroidia bacterium]
MKEQSLTDPRTKRPEQYNYTTTTPMDKPQSRISRHFTGNTPEVILDKNIGTAFLFGRLLCSNPHDFFQPLIEWATHYIESPQEVTVVTINTDYINTGSSKALLEFLRILAKVQYTGRKIIIKYYCDKGDEDTIELIENISTIIKVKIEIEQPE